MRQIVIIMAQSVRFLYKKQLAALVAGCSLFGSLTSVSVVNAQDSTGNRSATIETIEISGSRLASGYNSRTSEIGLGFEAETLLVPQSIQVISRELIDDQQPYTLSDIIRNTSGVGAPRNSIEPFNSFKLRGFEVSESFTDGIRNTNALNIQAGGMASIESVEVLRGPGGAMYGLSSPGGVVNVVSRKPTQDSHISGTIRAGNLGNRQIAGDIGGSLATEGVLSYRLVAQYEERDSFVDFVGAESWQLAPSLQWSIAPKLSLLYQGDWRRREGLRYFSLPLEGTLRNTNLFRLDRSLFTGEPQQGNTVNDSEIHTLTFRHSENAGNSSRLYGRFINTDYDQPSVAVVNFREDGRSMNRRFNQFVEHQDEWIVGTDMVRTFQGFGFQHVVSAGINYAEWTYDSEFIRGSVGPLDLLAPVYGSPIAIMFVLAESKDQFEQLGGSLQDYIAVRDNLHLLLGVRWDRLVNETANLQTGTVTSSADTQWSPRFGLSLEAMPGIAPYISYSRTFVANASFGFVRSPDGRPFGPQRGSQMELGVKFDLLDSLTSTISVFDIEQSNVLTVDPLDPFFRVPTGMQQSKGIEFSGTYESEQGISLLTSYAYTDAEVAKDTVIASGTRLDNVPRHTARLWGRYARSMANDYVVGINAGATYSSSAPIAIGGPLKVDSWTVLEGGIFVSKGPLLAELKVDNISDRDYLLRGAFGGNGVVPGDARRVMLSLSWRP